MKQRWSLCLAGAIALAATTADAWVVRYHPPTGDASAPSVAVDKQGNTFIALAAQGADGLDFITLKYDSFGVQRWERTFDGPGTGDDIPTGVAVDTSGRVFTAGTAVGPTGLDYCVVSYDNDGSERWSALFDDLGHADNFVFGVRPDYVGGCFVTGTSDGGSSRGDDILTVAFDSVGQHAWDHAYNGAGSGADYATAMVGDPAGICYVAGASTSPNQTTGYVMLKFSERGLRWLDRFDPDSNAVPRAMYRDVNGNLYVTGSVWYGEPAGWDGYTIRYNQNDTLVWTARYSAGAGSDDHGVGIGSDADTNAYIAVVSQADSTQLSAVGYLPSGGMTNLTSQTVSGDSAFPFGNILGLTDGRFILTGSRMSATTGWDYFATGYDSFWDVEWDETYDWIGDDEHMTALTTHRDRFYLTGLSRGSSGGWDAATLRWSTSYPGVFDRPAAEVGKPVTARPSPARGRVSVCLPGKVTGVVRVSVLNVNGRLRRRQTTEALDGRTDVDLADLPAGVYIVRLEAGRSAWQTRVILSR